MPQAAPPAQFNFAAQLFERNAARASKVAYTDDHGSLTYGELERQTRCMAAALRAAGVRRDERVLLRDAGQQPLAGGLPRLPVCGGGAGGGEHAAHRRRLRLHAGAQPRAARADVAAVLPALQAAMASAAARSARGVGVAAEQPARRGPGRLRTAARRGRAACGAGRHRRRRAGVLAVFVGLDRPPEGHGAHPRQPVLDRRALRPGRARHSPRTTSASRRPSCSSPTAWAMRSRFRCGPARRWC